MPQVKPQPGDFGTVATAGPFLDRVAAKVIRWDTATPVGRSWQDSPVNHAFVCIGSPYPSGTPQIVEAVSRVRIDWADEYDGEQITWSTGRLPEHLTPTDAQRVAIVAAASAMVGRKYNWLDLIAIGLAQKRAGGLVTGKEWWVKRLSDDNHLICSQLVDAAYEAAGIHLFDDGRLPGLVSPADIYRLLLPAT